jgi:hypothetical protein
MGKKRNSKSVILTILVTVIVLAVLSFIAIKFLLPSYVQQHQNVDVQYKIYRFAVRLFPLLVGIVLIVIASMIINSKDEDEVDEDDLLPPNSYDDQLFENPNDDPIRRVQNKVEVQEEIDEPEPVVISSDTISDDDFLSIYNNEEEKKPEPVIEEKAEPQTKTESADNVLADAVYALVNKLDKQSSVKDEKADYSALESKVDRLSDAVAKLSELVAANAFAVKAEPVKTEPAVKKAPAKKAPAEKKPAAPKKVEVPEEQRQINDLDAKDPVHLMRVEFNSAQEDEYDITFAFTKKKADEVKSALGEIADTFSVKGKTVVVIPFLTKEEAEAELDREKIKYSSVFVSGSQKANFDDVVLSRL